MTTESKKVLRRAAPQQARSAQLLRRLAEAAVQVYNDPKIGRDRMTTAMVADLAGVSIGSVYRYFPDRVALMDYIAPDRDQSPAPPLPSLEPAWAGREVETS